MDKFILLAPGRLLLLLIISLVTIFLLGNKKKYLNLIFLFIFGALILIRPFEFWEDRQVIEAFLMGEFQEPLFKGHLMYLFVYVFPTFKLKIYFINFLFSYSLWRLYKILEENTKANSKDFKFISMYFICIILTLFPTIIYFHTRQALAASLYFLSFKRNISNNINFSLTYQNIKSLSLKLISIVMHPINFIALTIELFFSRFYIFRKFSFKQLGFKKLQNITLSIFLIGIIFTITLPFLIQYISEIYVFFANLIPGFSTYGNWSSTENTSDPIVKLLLSITLLTFPLSLKSNSGRNIFRENSNYAILLYSTIFMLVIELTQSYLQLYAFDRLSSGLYPILLYSLIKEIMMTKNIQLNVYSYLGLISVILLVLIRLFNLTNAYSYYLT